MEKIYIRKKDSVITGPYDIAQLRHRGLLVSDKIWYEGLPEWLPVAKIDFLRRYVSAKQSGLFSRILGVAR